MRAVSGKRPALSQKSNPYTVLSSIQSTAITPIAQDDLGELDFQIEDHGEDHGEPEIHQLQVRLHWQEATDMYKRTLWWQNEDLQTQADWTTEFCLRLNRLLFPSFAEDEDDWELAIRSWQLATVREGRV